MDQLSLTYNELEAYAFGTKAATEKQIAVKAPERKRQSGHEQLCREPVLHADETTLQVLKEPGRSSTSKSYMWLYRTSGCAKQAIVLYEYQAHKESGRILPRPWANAIARSFSSWSRRWRS